MWTSDSEDAEVHVELAYDPTGSGNYELNRMIILLQDAPALEAALARVSRTARLSQRER